MSNLLPNGKQHYDDNNGIPLVGGQLFTYMAGTTTPLQTTSDFAGLIPNTNPIVLDARGEAVVFWNGAYKVVLEDALGNVIWTVDNVMSNAVGMLADGSALTIIQALNLPASRTAQEIAAGVTPVNYGYAAGDVRRYGGIDDNATDNQPFFATALSCNAVVTAPGGTYYFASGITVPNGVTLQGASMLPGSPAGGTIFRFALATATCVTMTAGNNGTAALKRCTVTRLGAPPANSVGVYVNQAYNCVLEDVFSFNHDRLYSFYAHLGFGISANMQNCYGGAAVSNYFYLDNWPELRIVGGRMGTNGAADYAANAFFYLTGDDSSGSGGLGPNSILATDVQFNQGVAGPAYFFEENSILEGVGNAVAFLFTGCYIEAVTTAMFYSTSTAPNLGRLVMDGCIVNCPAAAFFAVNAAVNLFEFTLANNHIFTSSLTLALTSQVNFLTLSGNDLSTPVSLTGVAGSTAVLNGNTYRGGLTVAGVWGALNIAGGVNATGVFTSTATGAVSVSDQPINNLIAFTPVLQFGGANAGMTSSIAYGTYQVNGNAVTLSFEIALTAKGTSTGAAVITGVGLPKVNTIGSAVGCGGSLNYAINMAALTTTPLAQVGQLAGAPVIALEQFIATGGSALTDANFTNTSHFAAIVTYLKG